VRRKFFFNVLYATVFLSEIREKNDPAPAVRARNARVECVFSARSCCTPHNMILFKIKYYIPRRRSAPEKQMRTTIYGSCLYTQVYRIL